MSFPACDIPSRDKGAALSHVRAIERDDPMRADAEAFVAHVYERKFDARLLTFMPTILGFFDRDDHLRACLGIRFAAKETLFVEQYLTAPAENFIASEAALGVPRIDLLEVGGFASHHPGDARQVIRFLAPRLKAIGIHWVIFSATRQIHNAFQRMGLTPVVLAQADKHLLQPDGTDWGTYYETHPHVLLGDVDAGCGFFEKRAQRRVQVASAGAATEEPIIQLREHAA